MNRDRFPALREGWARLDGPAGSQVVDSAIEAMADWMRSGSQANHGGQFKQAHETDELVSSTRAAVATLLGGEPAGRLLRAELHGVDDALRGDGRALVCRRATRSSARGWTTTPTCARG